MKTKLIQTKDYLLLTDEEAKISKGNYVYSVLYGIGQIIRDIGGESTKEYRPLIARFQESEVQQEYGRDGIWQMGVEGEKVAKNNCKKIVAYYPLTKKAKELDLPLLPPFEETNIEKLADNYAVDTQKVHPADSFIAKQSYIEGYKAAQAKQFSLEDIRKIAQAAFTVKSNNETLIQDFDRWFEKRIQSLSAQQFPEEFTPEYDEIIVDKLVPKMPIDTIKTITNSEGKKVLVGTYKY